MSELLSIVLMWQEELPGERLWCSGTVAEGHEACVLS